jgi:hypothetical protein
VTETILIRKKEEERVKEKHFVLCEGATHTSALEQ